MEKFLPFWLVVYVLLYALSYFKKNKNVLYVTTYFYYSSETVLVPPQQRLERILMAFQAKTARLSLLFASLWKSTVEVVVVVAIIVP